MRSWAQAALVLSLPPRCMYSQLWWARLGASLLKECMQLLERVRNGFVKPRAVPRVVICS